MMFTAKRVEQNGAISSVMRCTSLKQLRAWALINGHVIAKGHDVSKAIKSGACVRLLNHDGRVSF